MNQTQKPSVKIIDINDTSEALALRAVLEYWNIKVDLDSIATANQLIEIVNNLDSNQKLIFIMSHGDKSGFVLPELAPKIATQQRFTNHIAPLNIKNNFKFNQQILISTACKTGTIDFANAFINSGISNYIAPISYPEGSFSLKFCIDFSYEFLIKNNTPKNIFKLIRCDNDEDRFDIFT